MQRQTVPIAVVSIAGSTGLVVSNTYHSRIHKQDRTEFRVIDLNENFKDLAYAGSRLCFPRSEPFLMASLVK
jgi:hypothetical protein